MRLLLALVLHCLVSAAAALPTTFAVNYGGTTGGSSYTSAMTLDPAGNLYFGGSFDEPTFPVGNLSVSRIGASDAFVFRSDADGHVAWVKNLGGPGAAVAITAMATDSTGHLFVAGYFQSGNLTTPAVTRVGTSDGFVVKLDSTDGSLLWATGFGGSGAYATMTALAIDPGGQPYAGGSFTGAALTTPSVSRSGNVDALVARLDAGTGATTWVKSFSGAGATVSIGGIATDNAGHVSVAGTFSAADLASPPMTRIGFGDAFLIRLDSQTGNVLRAANYGGTGVSARGSSVAIDAAGDVYLAGGYRGGNLTTPPLSAGWDGDTFAIRVDGVTGTTLWATDIAGATNDQVITVGQSGIVVAGTYVDASLMSPSLPRLGVSDLFVVTLDPSNGHVDWARSVGGANARARIASIRTDATGSVFVGGNIDLADLTSPPLKRTGSSDPFFVRYDAATGAAQLARSFGHQIPGGTASVTDITADSTGNRFVAGVYDNFTLALGAASLSRTGSRDAFVARLDDAGNVVWARSFGGSGATVWGAGIEASVGGTVQLAFSIENGSLADPALPRLGTMDAVVVSLDSTTGALVWAKNFGGAGVSMTGGAITADGNGHLFVGGSFRGTPTVPAMTRIGTSGASDAFVLELDAGSGAVLWAANFGGGTSTGAGVAQLRTDPSGNVLVAGSYSAAMTKPLLAKIGFTDTFALKLDGTNGSILWAKSFGGAPPALAGPRGLAVDALGNAYLAGYVAQGSMTTPLLAPIGFQDAWVTRLDGATGNMTWANSFGGSSSSAAPYGMQLDGAGHLTLAGTVGSHGLSKPPLSQIGTADAWLLRIDSQTGTPTWTGNFGGAGANASAIVSVDGAGRIVVGGNLSRANMTSPPLTRIGTQDVFVLGIPPSALLYDGNGNTGGSAPSDNAVYVEGETAVAAANPGHLVKTGFAFDGWNSAADGSGTTYRPGASITVGAGDTKLFARWMSPTLDIDGNQAYDALTDGVLAVRYLFGLAGPAMIRDAIADGAPRNDPASVAAYLDSMRPSLDFDGDGGVDALSDGLLLIRYLFGLRGEALVANAISPGATRTTATDVERYIQSLLQ